MKTPEEAIDLIENMVASDIAILLLVITTLHSSLGFFSVLAVKLLDDLSANCFASCPTWTSRFFMADSVLFWLDIETYIN